MDVSFGQASDFLDLECEKMRLAAVASVRREMYRSTGKLGQLLSKPPYQTTASVSEASEISSQNSSVPSEAKQHPFSFE